MTRLSRREALRLAAALAVVAEVAAQQANLRGIRQQLRGGGGAT